MPYDNSNAQSESIAILERRGFLEVSSFPVGEDTEGQVVVMRKTISRISHLYAEVDTDGSVNGQTVGEFIKTLKLMADRNKQDQI